MNNTIKRTWNQGSMVNIEDLRGMTFQAESGGHTFVISAVDADGNAVSLSGTPAGTMLRPDNTDQALTCSISGGKVYATLPAGCYDVPGRAGITIFLTSNSQKVAIYAAVVSVTRTQSGTASPGTTASVVDLVNAINTAISGIPATDTALKAAMAPTYSNSALYAVGEYAWYNGTLYRCTTAITTAETWTSGHWTAAAIGTDSANGLRELKSAMTHETIFTNKIPQTAGLTFTNGVPKDQGRELDPSTSRVTTSYFIPKEGDVIKIASPYGYRILSYNGTSYTSLVNWKNTDHTITASNESAGSQGIVIQVRNNDHPTWDIAADDVKYALSVYAVNVNNDPNIAKANEYTQLNTKVTSIETDVTKLKDEVPKKSALDFENIYYPESLTPVETNIRATSDLFYPSEGDTIHIGSPYSYRVLKKGTSDYSTQVEFRTDDYTFGSSAATIYPNGAVIQVKNAENSDAEVSAQEVTIQAECVIKNIAPDYDVCSLSKYKVLKGQVDYLNEIVEQPAVPSYWLEAIATAEGKILANKVSAEGNIAEMFFITDQHWSSNAKKSSVIINKIANDTRIPLVLSGGDIINSEASTKTAGATEIDDYMKSFEYGYIRVLQTIGNHDTNNNTTTDATKKIGYQEFYNIAVKQAETFTDDAGNPYFVIYDNESIKVRYITYACPWNRDGTNNDILSMLAMKIGELSAGWTVILMTHIYWSGQMDDTAGVNYAKKIAEIAGTCDATIACLLVGHTHKDDSTVITDSNGGKLLIISTATDSYSQMAAGSEPQYTMTKGTTTEQLFDVVQVDISAKTIKMTRIGAGSDREFDYDPESETFGEITT